MLTLTTLSLDSYNRDQVTISWVWNATSEPIVDYALDIYRSDGPGTAGSIEQYTLIGSGISATESYFTDVNISGIYNFGRTWYYKLVLTNTLTEAVSHLTDTPLYKFYQTEDYAYNEILIRKRIVLDKKSGRTVKLLKKRSWGTRCTDCWDSVLYRSNDPDCITCHGTTWIGGYFNYLDFKAIITPSPQYNQITMFGEWMPSDVLLTTLNFPIIAVKDVIVDEKNTRWEVKNIRPLEKLGYIIEQAVQLARIVEDDPVYLVEVE